LAKSDKVLYCKVSDQILTAADIVGAKSTNTSNSNEVTENNTTYQDGVIITCSGVIIVSSPSTFNGLDFSIGVYFIQTFFGSSPWYITSFKAKEIVHELDEQYIPTAIARASDVIPVPAITSVG
jgi:hypothetical protein